MPRKLTTKEVVERARKVHGYRYGYDKVVYLGGRTKVIITCPEHGDFKQEATSHLMGHGCAKCSGNAKLTTEEFIERSRGVHGDRYGYGKVKYVATATKVTITCPEHGDFEQTPDGHLRGQGCIKCAGKIRLTTKEFIGRSHMIHNGRYGYDKVRYKNISTKVTITCPEHGDFEQTPKRHLQGMGCAECSGNVRLTTGEFIKKACDVHGARYRYDKVEYLNSSSKVTITCPEHGDFEQAPASHLQGTGCSSCAGYGYDKSKQGYVYFLLDVDTHSRVKIGISNRPEHRLIKLRRSTPFSIEPMRIIPVEGMHAPMIEKLAHNSLVSANLTGFDGATEWFNYDGEAVNQLIEFCDHHL